MSVRCRFVLAIICISIALPLHPASAQQRRGQLIEGLFRTLAETQLEKERIKRAEAEERATELKKAEQARTKDPYEVSLPSGFGPKPTIQSPRVTQPAPRSASINVRSREAAEYAQNLVNFNQQISPLVNELRVAATKNAAIRGLMPEAYAIAADGRALLQRCDGLSSLDSIIDPYRELDSRWRQFSFNLNNVQGLSPACSTAVSQCDKFCGLMAKQLRMEPQFDRLALHDVMTTASVYMQAMIDDLEIAVPDRNQCNRLTHDLRLMRQRLIAEAKHVNDTGYDEMAARFGEFAGQWRAFANQVYAINNPHLHRRLDRISECGEQTYRLLRITPPMSAADLTAASHRLHEGFESVFGQMTLRSMVRLQPQDQIRLMQACREVHQQAEQLEELLSRNASRDQCRDLFVKIDRGWSGLQSTLTGIPALNRGTMAEIDRSCEQLRSGFGIGGVYTPTASLADLLQAAAALEGTAEYLDAQLKRYDRQLKPSSYRDSIRDAARELHRHSKDLYQLLDRRDANLNDERFLSKLQSEAEHLLEGWNQLTQDLSHVQEHGLSASQARSLTTAQRQVAPFVADIAAALLQ